jgi:hypothetical protein
MRPVNLQWTSVLLLNDFVTANCSVSLSVSTDGGGDHHERQGTATGLDPDEAAAVPLIPSGLAAPDNQRPTSRPPLAPNCPLPQIRGGPDSHRSPRCPLVTATDKRHARPRDDPLIQPWPPVGPQHHDVMTGASVGPHAATNAPRWRSSTWSHCRSAGGIGGALFGNASKRARAVSARDYAPAHGQEELSDRRPFRHRQDFRV